MPDAIRAFSPLFRLFFFFSLRYAASAADADDIC